MHRTREIVRCSAHSASRNVLARSHRLLPGEIVGQNLWIESTWSEKLDLGSLDCGCGYVAVWVGGEGGKGVGLDVIAAENELRLIGTVLGESLEGHAGGDMRVPARIDNGV